MWRVLLAVPLLMHGLAHLSGFLASWTPADAGYGPQPWLFSSNITLRSPTGRAFGLLWLASAIGLVGAALGLVLHQPWWPVAAGAAALMSLAAILPWWYTVPPGAKIGAAFDLLVIVLLLSPARDGLLSLVR